MANKSKVILASFADGIFFDRKEKFLDEARAMNIFSEILFFDSSQLPEKFRSQHMGFMQSQKRGFGYWIWKPQVIGLALEQAENNDIVVYLDAGFTLNSAARARFQDYIDITMDSPFRMLSFQNVHTEAMWTKADLANRLGVGQNSHIMKTSQLGGGFVMLGKTSSNLDLISQWQEIAIEDNYRYSDDSPSVAENHPTFREHRHDQSIFSLLRKLRGTTITHYEVQPYTQTFENMKSQLPAWATRSRV